ncbi:MAG: DNA polymerase III subunit delta [Alphaproteobacteria bacterium]|nr:MAG: DNA polymerase III subunit delta [Alphaproteobacteria bacterium]
MTSCSRILRTFRPSAMPAAVPARCWRNGLRRISRVISERLRTRPRTMVKVGARALAQVLRTLPEDCRGALLYGPDEGLVRERAEAIARQIVDDPGDPFRVSRLTAAALKADPAALADAMGALSMTGGRRLVLLDLGGETTSGLGAIVAAALDHPGDAFLLVRAGELAPRHSLRTFFEKAPDLAAIACYADSADALGRLLDETLAAAGFAIDPAARDYLRSHLGQDRAITRQELEKLILFKTGDDARRISLADVRAVIGDTASNTVFDLVAAVTAGDLAAVDRYLEKAFAVGEQPVAILRLLARRFQQIDLVLGHMAAGLSREEALGRLVPRLFFRDRDRFMRDLARWPAARVRAALDRLLEAEADCKTSDMPAVTICARTCLALAASAAGSSARR